ncbi:MAG: sugar phosphate nucleotidyltransferase [bacterium]|nr:sugar phosphate nucleotidyltransferase [bacterium]
MKVIIPVAGIGKRLKPHTDSLPKPLLTVAGRTILDHVLRPLKKIDVEELVLVIGYKGELIREYVDKNYNFNTRYVEQEKLLGLGYALNLAIRETEDGPLLIILGDTIVECDLSEFTGAGDFVLGLREVPDPERFGVAEIENGFIASLEEKPSEPKSNLGLIGLYYFSDSLLLKQLLGQHVDSGKLTSGEIQFTDALQEMIQAGTRFVPYTVSGWFDCGTVRTLIEASAAFIARMEQPQPPAGSAYISPVFVAPDAQVKNSIIGPNVTIESGATVENSVLKDTIVNAGASVVSVVVENSIIGRDSDVRGRAQTLSVGRESRVIFEALLKSDK